MFVPSLEHLINFSTAIDIDDIAKGGVRKIYRTKKERDHSFSTLLKANIFK